MKKVSFSNESTRGLPVLSPTSVIESVSSESVLQLQELEGLCKVAQIVGSSQELVRRMDDNTKTRQEVHVKGHERNNERLSFKPLFDAISAATNIDRKTTLLLAITLTASVLQLHDTPWLSDNWGNGDLTLPNIQGDVGDQMLGQVYICKSLEQQDGVPTSANQATELSTPGVRNKCLFSLGAALIEVWFGQTMNELQVWEDVEQSSLHEDTQKITTAFRLIDRIYRQAGDWYGDAVRRCLYCDFNQRHTELAHGSMKGAVFTGVLVPLIEHLKALYGGNLGEITPLTFA